MTAAGSSCGSCSARTPMKFQCSWTSWRIRARKDSIKLAGTRMEGTEARADGLSAVIMLTVRCYLQYAGCIRQRLDRRVCHRHDLLSEDGAAVLALCGVAELVAHWRIFIRCNRVSGFEFRVVGRRELTFRCPDMECRSCGRPARGSESCGRSTLV